MQAKLPDINNRLISYMSAAERAYNSGDFEKAAICFRATIALLPEEYKLEINTQKYNELVQNKHLIICTACKVESIREKIIPYQVLLTSLDRLVTRQQTIVVWGCPACEHVEPLNTSQLKTIKYQNPSYFGVVPEPPMREGFHDRIGFSHKSKIWYGIVCPEIENKVMLYRTEYAAQQLDVQVDTSDE
jgi:hypothetical protein